MQKKILTSLLLATFLLTILSESIFAQESGSPNSQSNSQGEVKADFTQSFVEGLFSIFVPGFSGAIERINSATEQFAECSDTLQAVDGTPNAVLGADDEHRAIGKGFDCGLKDVGTIHFEGVSVVDGVSVSVPPGGWTGPVTTNDLAPEENLKSTLLGITKAHDSGSEGTAGEEIRGYLGGDQTYKELTHTKRIYLKDNDGIDPILFVNIAGVGSKLEPYMCGDEPCDQKRRKDVLRKSVRGYYWSRPLMEARGIKFPTLDFITPFLPDGAVNFWFANQRKDQDVNNDQLVGFIHSKSANQTGSVNGYMTDTAISTYELGIAGELPLYGIVVACYMGLDVPGVPVDQVCSQVVGPNYKQGMLALDGLLCKQLTETGMSPNGCYMVYRGENMEWADDGATLASPMPKLGVNFATLGNTDAFDHVARLKMGFGVTIANYEGDAGVVAQTFAHAASLEITPVLRVCFAGASCFFNDVNKYISFIQKIATSPGVGNFYVLAGPNEPNTEVWLGGKEGEPSTYAAQVASYMNAIIAAKSRGEIPSNALLLSPAFNMSWPGFESEVKAMAAAGANFAALDGIAGNAYNNSPGDGSSTPISGWILRLKEAGLLSGNQGLVLTETGAFLDKGGDRVTLLKNLGAEICKIIDDPTYKILGMNLFSMFGTNSQFSFHAIKDQEYAKYIANGSCGEPTIAANTGGHVPVLVEYFTSKLGVMKNISNRETQEADVQVIENTELTAIDRALNPECINNPDCTKRQSIKSYPAVGADTAKYISKFILPYESIKNCEEIRQEIPSEYDKDDIERAIDGTTGTFVPGPEFSGSRQYSARNENVSLSNSTSQTQDQSVGVSRPIDMFFGVHESMEELVRYTVNSKCGTSRAFLPFEWTEALDTEIDGIPLFLMPTSASVLDCKGDSKCDQGKSPSSIFGGVNLTMNPSVVGESGSELGLVPAGTVPFSGEKNNLTSSIWQIAKRIEKERYAKSPWLMLASYENPSEDSTKHLSLQ